MAHLNVFDIKQLDTIDGYHVTYSYRLSCDDENDWGTGETHATVARLILARHDIDSYDNVIKERLDDGSLKDGYRTFIISIIFKYR